MCCQGQASLAAPRAPKRFRPSKVLRRRRPPSNCPASDLWERAYQPVADLPGVPYACLRLPTGGGKTLLAAHSVGHQLVHLNCHCPGELSKERGGWSIGPCDPSRVALVSWC